MTLVGVKATHPWLDSRMRVVGYTPIESDEAWHASRLLLGNAVHEVVKHFQLQSPHLLEITDAGLRRLQSNLTSRTTGSQQQPPRPQQLGYASTSNDTAAPPDYESLFQVPEMPDIPTQFGEYLNTMSREDMQQLLDDELDFLAFASTLPAYKEIQKVGSTVFEENVETARANLAQEERLKRLHQDVTALQSSLKTKLAAFEALEQEQDKLCATPDKKSVVRQLLKAKRQAMDESEAHAEEWVENGDHVEDFLEKFMKMRTLHHVRAAKVERLQCQK